VKSIKALEAIAPAGGHLTNRPFPPAIHWTAMELALVAPNRATWWRPAG
jgi:hypothetical protein